MSTKSILTVSRDAMLQQTRVLILRGAGFHVSPAANDEEAIAFLNAPNTLELVMLCHSVPEPSKLLLVSMAKKLHPTLPIFMLYSSYESTAVPVDGSLHNLDSPEAMLKMVKFLTGRSDYTR